MGQAGVLFTRPRLTQHRPAIRRAEGFVVPLWSRPSGGIGRLLGEPTLQRSCVLVTDLRFVEVARQVLSDQPRQRVEVDQELDVLQLVRPQLSDARQDVAVAPRARREHLEESQDQMRIVLSCVVGGLLATAPVLAAEQTWTGQISDSMCGVKHMSAEHGKNPLSDRDCAQACVQKSARYVLVVNGTIYKLMNRDADLKAHAGQTVNLTGDLTGETIRVANIDMSKGTK
jgi:hypothetical protein